jgi:hypothetical protein
MEFSWAAVWPLVPGLSRAMASRFVVLALLAAPAMAQQTPVAVELVLALDSSASVDGREFALQIEGLALAFADPEVQRAVENLKPLGAAVAVVQWGAPGETRIVLPFTHLETARDSKAFGFRIGLARRWMWASATSIATAIADGTDLIETNDFDGFRKIIDVSGDGEDNAGADLEAPARRPRPGASSSTAFPSWRTALTSTSITATASSSARTASSNPPAISRITSAPSAKSC